MNTLCTSLGGAGGLKIKKDQERPIRRTRQDDVPSSNEEMEHEENINAITLLLHTLNEIIEQQSETRVETDRRDTSANWEMRNAEGRKGALRNRAPEPEYEKETQKTVEMLEELGDLLESRVNEGRTDPGFCRMDRTGWILIDENTGIAV